MNRIRIQHRTDYLFSTPVTLNPHRLLLRPREGHDVRIESSRLDITPTCTIQWHRDAFDNSLAVVYFPEPAESLSITSDVIIQHYDHAPFDFTVEGYAMYYPFRYSPGEQIDLAVFQQPVYVNDQQMINDWLLQFNLYGMETFGMLVKLNQIINHQFLYRMREEPGVQSPAMTLSLGSGSCRDYATLFIESCRTLGLASRFVSGYLHADSTEAGNASTHAWVEIFIPGTGWKGFDPTTGLVTGNAHIAVAVARDPETVPPVSGSYTGPANVRPTMLVNVQVNQVTE